MSKKTSKKYDGGINKAVESAVLRDSNLSRETIKSWLKKDLEGIYVVLAETLRSDECIEALTEVHWKKYQAFHAQKEKESAEINGVAPGENPLDPNQTKMFNE